MKVVFIENVPHLATAGEIKEVADGYGRNFLIPRKLALPANSPAVKQIEAKRQTKARRDARTGAEIAELGRVIDGKEITIKARVGAEERLHGAITAADITAALDNEGITVDKRKIELSEPIHHTGSYDVTIRLLKDVVPVIKVTVAAED
jgi:large subunit ribosomal protein L9